MRGQLERLLRGSDRNADADPISVAESHCRTNAGAQPVGNYDAFGCDQIRGRGANASVSGALAGFEKGRTAIHLSRTGMISAEICTVSPRLLL
jgi:hypothetical protein